MNRRQLLEIIIALLDDFMTLRKESELWRKKFRALEESACKKKRKN